MIRIISALLGFYAPFMIGYLFRRKGIINSATTKALSKLVLYFFFPILLFVSLYKKNLMTLSSEFFYMIISSLYIIFTSMCIALLFFGKNRELLMPASYINAGYLPIPIAYSLWGMPAVSLIGFYILVNTTLGNIMAPIMFGSNDFKEAIRKLIKFPPLYAIIVGLSFATLNVKIPPELENTLANMGSVAPYLALIVLGSQITNVKSSFMNTEVQKTAIIRFIASPLLVFLLMYFYPPPTVLASKIVELESFMPPAVANVIYANEYSSNPERVSQIVFTLTLMATFILPIVLVLITY